MSLSKIAWAVFDYMFGLQLKTREWHRFVQISAADETSTETLQELEEDDRGHARPLGGTSHAFDEEWETIAFPPPFFSLTGQVPTHIVSTWR
ncbi:hypothetical protein TRAPUB_2534 [Trametes pubescens]|uniref:Uncharacterized protein n=1 Tax=Trametes pubescens TaxID=154538 RepID=A0A1M2VGD2_TRAPU|nr:hypothetical protein TRAPUB_2534 [Trametes pubescens]